MLIPDNELGLSSHQATSLAHPVLQWANAVANNLDTAPHLRNSVVEMHHDLRGELSRRRYRAIFDYTRSHNWTTIEPDLTDHALSLSKQPELSQSQLEVIGFAKLVHSETRLLLGKRDEMYPLGIKLDPVEFGARFDFSEDFGDGADWLTAMASVVWVNGKQLEAEAKEEARVGNLGYLQELQPKVDIDDIEYVYQQTVRAIRPNATTVPVFRALDTEGDTLLNSFCRNPRLRYLVTHSSATMRRRVIENHFLPQYNELLQEPDPYDPISLAWIYGTYIGIHPHPDYNGTMTRTLVDNYLHKRGLPMIDWLQIKKDIDAEMELVKAWDKYAFAGDREILEDWFRGHVPSL
ncbi:hypothetical protein HYW41_01465 [Candidatus Daviesbacteria bacterium]|nr:hypothetical protein [Candidatus Daviesbacteria bacterium]